MSKLSKALIAAAGNAGGSIYAGGASYGSGKPYFQYIDFVSNNIYGSGTPNYTESIETSGYNGTIDIFVAGCQTEAHLNYNYENSGDGDCSGTGEMAFLKYVCQGDETGFTITQNDWSNNNRTTFDSGTYAHAVFNINGGVNNGKLFKFGSAAGRNASFGISGAASPVSDDSYDSSCFTHESHGATRQDSTLYYSDATSYPPSIYDDYGTAAHTETYSNTSYVTINQKGTNTYNLSWRDNVTGVTFNKVKRLSLDFGGVGGKGFAADAAGGVLLVYRNDH